LDKAVDLAVLSRLNNCGQVCFAGKRFIIEDRVYDEFRKKLLHKVKEFKLGDPMKSDTQLGPMARPDLVEGIDNQVQRGLKQGGKLLCGGVKGYGEFAQGNFYLPTIVEVSEDNVLNKEETFGPVFALLRAKNEDDAVRIANGSDYGLGAVIVSRDLDRADKLAKRIESGMVFVNEVVKSDSRLPSGGVKMSGFGRECGEFGIHEFANIKTVWVA